MSSAYMQMQADMSLDVDFSYCWLNLEVKL